MSRSHRLFELMQAMRRHRGTVSGETLARETGVSLRTIRRDIATLQDLGAGIEGEAGVGYVLRPGFLLPPLSFTEEEIQALVVGAQWVSRQTDAALVDAARNALAKIGGVVPAEMRPVFEDDMFYIGDAPAGSGLDLGLVRRAIREQHKMRLLYTDRAGETAERWIWPVVLGFVESRWSIAAWCEREEAFRIFLAPRIHSVELVDERYPGNRRQLTKEWHRVCHQSMERSVE